MAGNTSAPPQARKKRADLQAKGADERRESVSQPTNAMQTGGNERHFAAYTGKIAVEMILEPVRALILFGPRSGVHGDYPEWK